MRQTERQEGAWSQGNVAAYSVVEWDDATGDAEIWEYDADDALLRHFVWTPDVRRGALLVENGPDGEEVARQRMNGPVRGW